jgi:hypothetical protein
MRGMMGEDRPEGPMMTAHTNAPIVRIQRGDTSIVIKCADNESTETCLTAAGTLIDKFQQGPTGSFRPAER